MERITEMLSRLSELSDGEMSDLEGSILSEFKTVEQQDPTAEVVETMTTLADALDAVRGEQSTRATQQQELAAKAAEAANRVQEATASSNEAAMDEEEDEEESDEEAPVEEEDEEEDELLFSDKTDSAGEAAVQEEAPAAAAEAAVVEEPAPEAAEAAEASDATEAPAAEASTEEPAVEQAAEAAVEELPDTPVEAEASEPAPSEPITEENPVAASASDVVVKPPADAQVSTIPRPPVTVTAGADIPGRTAGGEFTDIHEVGDAFTKRLHALRRVTGGDGEQHVVASIHADYPEDRTLVAGAAADNWEKIRNITSREALVAAVNCYPLDTQYSLFGVGVADRPVRDSLAVFSADRAGLRYYEAPTLEAIPVDGTGPMGVWQQDGSVAAVSGADLSGTKPCYTVACGNETEALLEAVSLCLTFDNLTTRANPEIIARHNELALIFHARQSELSVLNKIKAGGTAVAAASYSVGATREFFAQVDGLASAYRYKYRMGMRDPLRAILPEWFRDQIRADLAMQMPGDGLEVIGLAQSMIDGWFRQRNINVTWSLDSVATPPAVADGSFGGTVEWDLFAEGTWLYLDGGTLDIGVIRDSTLVGSNDYKTFTEEFLAVAKIGDESLHVTSTVQTSGAAAALEDNYS